MEEGYKVEKHHGEALEEAKEEEEEKSKKRWRRVGDGKRVIGGKNIIRRFREDDGKRKREGRRSDKEED